MKKFIMTCLSILSLLLLCCQDGDAPVLPAPISNYDFTNMHYPQGTAPSLNPADRVTLEYSANRIVKRTGGVRALDEGTGYSYAFSNDISDTVLYSGNRIVIEEGRVLPWYPEPQSRTAILMDPLNRMVQRINITPFPSSMDTIKYNYNTAGLLIRSTKGKLNNNHEISAYNYIDNNLTSILTTHYYNAVGVISTTEETFSYYDHAYNPLKNLYLFKETFYRSLSKNNYMKYDMVQYDADHNIMSSESRNWNILHDASGNIIF